MSGKPLLEKAAPATPVDNEENRGPPLDKRGVAGAIVICALVAAGIVVLCVYYIRRAPHDDAHGVTAVRLGSTPVISRANSAFDYSYNPASFVVPAPGAGTGGWLRGGDSRAAAAAAQGQHYLLVRVQNYNHSVGPYAVGTARAVAAAYAVRAAVGMGPASLVLHLSRVGVGVRAGVGGCRSVDDGACAGVGPAAEPL